MVNEKSEDLTKNREALDNTQSQFKHLVMNIKTKFTWNKLTS